MLTYHKSQFANEYLNANCDVSLAAECCGIATSTAKSWLEDLEVQDKIEDITQQHQDKYLIDREFLTLELLNINEEAKLKGKLEIRRKTIMDIGKVHGLIVDQSNVTSHQYQIMKDVTLDGKTLEFNIGNDGSESQVAEGDKPMEITASKLETFGKQTPTPPSTEEDVYIPNSSKRSVLAHI